jgi:hypothetical protein
VVVHRTRVTADVYGHLLDDARGEVERVLAAALADRERVSDKVDRVEEAHDDEVGMLHKHTDELDAEILHMAELHADEIVNLRKALESRDVIGQAKGVIMVTTRCTADQAFDLMRRQSQYENRKVVEVAAEVAERAAKRPPPR